MNKRLFNLILNITLLVSVVCLILGFVFLEAFGENHGIVDSVFIIGFVVFVVFFVFVFIGVIGYIKDTSVWNLLKILQNTGIILIIQILIDKFTGIITCNSIYNVFFLVVMVGLQYARKFYLNKIEDDDLKRE